MSHEVFTAELMQQRTQCAKKPGPLDHATAEAEAGAAARHQQILSAVARLERRLDALSSSHIGAAAPTRPIPPAAAADGQLEGLRAEVCELSQSIVETKRQIAALRNRNNPPDRLIRANDELDAVVRATEGATETILAAAEDIDAIAARMRASSALPANELAALEDISERTIRIFEACNFQDITGQRISKVVNTMKFVESRVERMIEIFGGPDSFADLEPPEVTPTAAIPDADAGLLHGPQLATDRPISQDDIDKLFD